MIRGESRSALLRKQSEAVQDSPGHEISAGSRLEWLRASAVAAGDYGDA